MDRRDDARSKKIIFVSSCLLNTNNKVQGLARYPGMCKEVFDTLNKYGLGINQMDCPETLYLGISRWFHTKNLYDNHGFRSFCREIAERVVTYMEEYKRAGYQTVGVLSCDGSPTCGVTITSWDERWGGAPVDLEYNDAIIEGEGVYIEPEGSRCRRFMVLPSMMSLWIWIRSWRTLRRSLRKSANKNQGAQYSDLHRNHEKSNDHQLQSAQGSEGQKRVAVCLPPVPSGGADG